MIKKFLFLGALILKQGLATEGLTFDGTSNVKIKKNEKMIDLPFYEVSLFDLPSVKKAGCYAPDEVYINALEENNRVEVMTFSHNPIAIYLNECKKKMSLFLNAENTINLYFLNCSDEFWESSFFIVSNNENNLNINIQNCTAPNPSFFSSIQKTWKGKIFIQDQLLEK